MDWHILMSKPQRAHSGEAGTYCYKLIALKSLLKSTKKWLKDISWSYILDLVLTTWPNIFWMIRSKKKKKMQTAAISDVKYL